MQFCMLISMACHFIGHDRAGQTQLQPVWQVDVRSIAVHFRRLNLVCDL